MFLRSPSYRIMSIGVEFGSDCVRACVEQIHRELRLRAIVGAFGINHPSNSRLTCCVELGYRVSFLHLQYD
jgi:hypothetical protein